MSDSNLKQSKQQKYSVLNFSHDPRSKEMNSVNRVKSHVSSCFIKKSQPVQNQANKLGFIKQVKSSEYIGPDPSKKRRNNQSTNTHSQAKDSVSFSKNKVNRYDLVWDEEELEAELKRLKPFKQGPLILVARNRKEYFKIMSLRKFAIFKLKKLVEIEEKFTPEDKYFEFVRDFRKKLVGFDERNIRGFLKFLYFQE